MTVALRLRMLPRFPARITGTDGVKVVRVSGSPDLTVSLDFATLGDIAGIPDPAQNYFAMYDAETKTYVRIPFQAMFDAAGVSSGYPTRPAAELANVPVPVHAIYLYGDATVGDGEGGLFIDTNNGNADTFVSGDGRTWYRAPDIGVERLTSANLIELSTVNPGTTGKALLATEPVSDAQTLLDIATKTIYDPSNFALPIRFKNSNFSMPPVPNNLVLYVMKTGNDTVTNDLSKGSTTGTAFLTIDAALNFAKKYWEFDGRMTVLELRIGAGSWGNFATGSSLKQGYDSYPFAIFLVAQDAATPANWPVFDVISIGGFINKGVYVENVTSGTFGVTRFNILCVNNVRVSPPVAPSTVTISIASPGVVSATGHGLANARAIAFSTTGALPTGLVAGTTYYVVGATTNTFNVAATPGGAAIVTTGTQSGVHTLNVTVPYAFYASLKGQLHVFGDIDVIKPIYLTSSFLYAQQQGSIGCENGDAPATFPMMNILNTANIKSPSKYRAVYGAFIYAPGNIYPQLTYASKFAVDHTSFSSQTTAGVDMKDNSETGGVSVAWAGTTTTGYEYFADGRLHKWGTVALSGLAVGDNPTPTGGVITYDTTVPFSASPRVEIVSVNNNRIIIGKSGAGATTQQLTAWNVGTAGQSVTVGWSAWGLM